MKQRMLQAHMRNKQDLVETNPIWFSSCQGAPEPGEQVEEIARGETTRMACDWTWQCFVRVNRVHKPAYQTFRISQ